MRTKISWQSFLTVLVIAVMAVSCKGSDKPLLPNISGKAGEVIVVMDKDNWDGNLGSVTRDLLTADYPFLPQREPLFSVVNVPPTGFADLFKIHRNILIYNVSADVRKAGVIYRNDQWAYPQCVIQISAPSADSAATLLKENGGRVVNAIEQAERDRIIENSKRYEAAEIAPVVPLISRPATGSGRRRTISSGFLMTSSTLRREFSFISILLPRMRISQSRTLSRTETSS